MKSGKNFCNFQLFFPPKLPREYKILVSLQHKNPAVEQSWFFTLNTTKNENKNKTK